MILRDKTQNLRRVWGAYVLENHAQKLGSLSKIGHIGHLGLGRVDFEKDVIKLPIFTRGFPCVTLTKIYDSFWDSGGAVNPLHQHHVGCEQWRWVKLCISSLIVSPSIKFITWMGEVLREEWENYEFVSARGDEKVRLG